MSKNISINTKISIYFFVFVSSLTTVLGTIVYLDFTAFTMSNVELRIQNETRLYSKNIENAFKSVESFSRVTAATPPFQGIIRSSENFGKDPVDGSKLDLWKNRLATIFESVIMENDHFTQLRFIQLADNGKEIVRVDRSGFNVFRVSETNLQEKASESYFKNSLALKRGEIYFSDVTFNRENGKVTEEKLPTLRAVYPIYKENTKKLFGFFVINIAFEKLLIANMPLNSGNVKVEVGTNTGTSIQRDYDSKFTSLDFKMDAQSDGSSSIVSKLEANMGLLESENTVSYYKKIFYNRLDLNDFVYVKLEFPKQSLFLKYDHFIQRNIVLGLAVVLSFSFLFLILSQKLLKPLKTMTRKILDAKNHSHKLYLDTSLPGELGHLASSFKGLADELHENFTKSETILNNIADGVISISSKGIILSCNQSVEKMFGYEISYLIGKNISMLMPQEYAENHDFFLERYFETMQTNVIGQKRELFAKKMDSELFPIELSVEEVVVSKKVIFIGVIRDISKRKRNEEKLMRAFSHLQNNKQELEVFNEVVLHDFEEPLLEVKESIYNIDDNQVLLPSKNNLKDVKNKIALLYDRLRSFRDYLTLDKIEEDSFETSLESVVNDLLLNDKNRDCLFVHYIDRSDEFMLSSRAIEKVLQCIFKDSIKNSQIEKKNIWVKVDAKKHITRFEIMDNSIGVNSSEQSKKLFKENDLWSIKDGLKNESIELSIARKLINKHGGRLVVSWEKSSVRSYVFTWPNLSSVEHRNSHRFSL
ncbi:MAG: PAS domain S-box protein [Bdellovibrionota bacterium]|nr:PAS domain S-box protein [Bdellovibrionota bacterium]